MLSEWHLYQAPQADLWQGRKDSLPGERFFQHVECVDVRQTQLTAQHTPLSALIGLCSDEGIRRNEGRLGARLGPDHLRKYLAKLACHNAKPLVDVGNILCEQGDLEGAQSQFGRLVAYCQDRNYRTFGLGGGARNSLGAFSGFKSVLS